MFLRRDWWDAAERFFGSGRKSPAIFALLGIIFYGAFLRGLYVVRDPVISRDGLLYLDQYNHWLTSPGKNSIAPMLQRLFQLGDWLLGDPVTFVRIFNITSGTLLIWVVYEITVCVWKQTLPGLLTALLIATNYTLIRNCGELQRESGYLLGCGMAFLCICRGLFCRGTSKDHRVYLLWGGGGFFAAISLLFRYEGAEIPVLAAGMLLLGMLFRRIPPGRAFGMLGIFGGVWLGSLILFSQIIGIDEQILSDRILRKLLFYLQRVGL